MEQPTTHPGIHAVVAGVLSTTTRRIDGVIVVYLSGAIFFDEESASLRIVVKDLLNESRQIVFDLGNVIHIDSGGVGTLVTVYASARKVGGDIKFANLGKHANEGKRQGRYIWAAL